jgi:RNA 2',3'-cyclic 3'-phosphodiesterase
MEEIRSFIAIELPEEVKCGLLMLQNRLKSVDPDCAKWVAPSGIHLTLKFLGNVNSDKIDSVIQAMRQAAKSVSPFHLELNGLGAFPNLRRVQIVWAGIIGDLDTLNTLQSNLETALIPSGFQPEKRPFTPHLTLARMRDNATPLQRQTLGEAISKTKFESQMIIQVRCLSLMKSQLTRAGAIYSCLSSVELSPSCQ